MYASFVVIEFQGSALNQNVQNIAATSSSSVTSYTAAVTSVVTNNALSIYAGSNIATVTTNVAEIKQYGTLTSSTVFTVHVNTGVADAKKYNCSIVEFASGVLNSAIQRGTTTLTAATSNTAALTTISFANSAVSWLGNTTTSTTAVLNRCEGQVVLGPVPVANVSSGSTGGTGGASSFTLSGLTATSAGNLIVVPFSCGPSSVTITGVTDNKSQVYTQVPSARATDSTTNKMTDIWYFSNTASGVTSITVTLSGASNSSQYDFEEIEVSGLKTSSPVDVSGNVSNGASGTSLVTAALTTTAANDYILTILQDGTSTILSVASPYASPDSSGATAFYNPATIVTSNSATYTITPASNYCASSVAFFANTSPPTQVTVQRNTATANITGSWEVAEFPAFSGSSSVGASAGTSTVLGVSASTGSSSGTATVTGAAIVAIFSTGRAAGTATVLGNSAAAATGNSSGIATVSGVTASPFVATATTSGISTVLGSAFQVNVTTGSASGTATVTGVGIQINSGVGSSTGTSTVTGVGAAKIISTAISSGVATVTGDVITSIFATGNSSGNATVTGAALIPIIAVGSAAGVATVLGIPVRSALTIGNAQGIATVLGYPSLPEIAVGNAQGIATVLGILQQPEQFALLEFMSPGPIYSTATMSKTPIAVLASMSNLLPNKQFMSNQIVNSAGVMAKTPIAISGSFL